MAQRIVLTGIKPTGTPHVGNLAGAIRPALELARDPDTLPFFFIADYHALIALNDAAALRQLTRDVAATWLAFGLDPERCVFYRQSDVPETFELAWALACFTPKGWMNKAHAYKARVQENEAAGADVDAGVNIGLFSYPVLMAADILLFRTDLVPVGKDQVQHVELARDVALRFNGAYGEDVLKLPQALIRDETSVVPGLDGRKMSKSHDNTIPLFAPAAELRKLVMRIKTDSSPPEAPKDPDTSHLFQIYAALAAPEQVRALRERYARGVGWGTVKTELYEMLDALVAGPRAIHARLMAETSELDRLLLRGADRARELARPTLRAVRETVGIDHRAS